uniref:Uncharacterized protein n=1 Tax=Oryza glumipatula TaxID=40148 RepID=A0A0D9ZS55_9ORYZ
MAAAAAMAASRRLLHLRPELGLRLRSRALIPYPSWTKAMGRCRYEPSPRRLSSCRRAAKNERPWRSSSNEQLTDGDGTAKYMGRNFPDEFAQLSLEEEESDDEVHGISETMVKDVEKAAVELLAGRCDVATNNVKIFLATVKKVLEEKNHAFLLCKNASLYFRQAWFMHNGKEAKELEHNICS